MNNYPGNYNNQDNNNRNDNNGGYYDDNLAYHNNQQPYYGNYQNDPNYYQNYQQQQYYQQYPFYTQYYRPKPRTSFGSIIFFLVIAGAVLVASIFTSNYLQNRQGVIAPPASDTADSGGNFGFRILPNEPLNDQQYALSKLNVPAAWKITQGQSNIIVAVIDTGVDGTHPDLKGKLVKGYDFINNSNSQTDNVGHGTFVASLIAASETDNSGISGIAPNVKIMPLKVLDTTEAGNSALVARAVRYAVDNGARVINISLGSNGASRSLRSATDYAISKGVIVVSASGNDGDQENTLSYPAAFPGVISVGATNSRDGIANFSTHNSAVAVSAPGVNIVGARSSVNQICRPYRTNAYCVASGTSFAAPYVTGTVALMLSVDPKLSVNQVTQILEETAKDLGPKGRDDFYGYGRIDTDKAVEAASALLK